MVGMFPSFSIFGRPRRNASFMASLGIPPQLSEISKELSDKLSRASYPLVRARLADFTLQLACRSVHAVVDQIEERIDQRNIPRKHGDEETLRRTSPNCSRFRLFSLCHSPIPPVISPVNATAGCPASPEVAIGNRIESGEQEPKMPSILDLYSGCGGFSLGAHQAGFTTSLAIDSDPLLSSSFPFNFPKARVLHRDMRLIDAPTLKAYLPEGVDGVIGGPPCQAFSEMGRRDRRDPRRRLVVDFFRIVALFGRSFSYSKTSPVWNSPGMLSCSKRAWNYSPANGPSLDRRRLNAADLGAPTRRLRLFVFGFNTDEMEVPAKGKLFRKANNSICVGEAIGDLMTAGLVGYDDAGFDFWRYDGRRAASPYAKRLRSGRGQFTGHRRTEHTRTTLKRFSRLAPGEKDIIGKYVRLSWDGVAPTLRAGTGSDRGSYQAVRPIHPDEDRVITPREAARLQGFPDKFLFHPTVWHSCRMIGNSVSPIVARSLLRRIAKYL